MRRYLQGLAAVLLVLAVVSPAIAQREGRFGPRTRVGVDVSEWSSDTATDVENGILPIGGSGQINGEFVRARFSGIEIAIRAQERFFGPIVPRRSRDVGVYRADVGESEPGLATWNYDWHVDLRNARGPFRDVTLDDYDLFLVTNIVGRDDTLFGLPMPLNLKFDDDSFPPGVVLYQGSFNPNFGNSIFDQFEARNYRFTLVLQPKGEGQPISVSMRVRVR
ncbi:MAG: hypothetical protein MPJ50_07930 [Pirellulales bacterium]|nr:hypothetical protein [Pirellulales bacterium]